MSTPQEKLAEALVALKALQDAGHIVPRAEDLSRAHRERLLHAGFLREAIKGWYVASRPDGAAGESTDWYTSFWAFCAAYLTHRFGADWCLSAEQSLALHAGNWTVPRQLLVRAPKGSNKPLALPHDTSLFDLRLALPAAQDITVLEGLRVMSPAAALVACAPGHFAAHSVDTRAVLAMLPDADDLLRRLLSGGHSHVAGRLAGALRNIGRDALADAVLATLRSAGYSVHEVDPFKDPSPFVLDAPQASPAAQRLRMMWARLREDVLRHFPEPPGLITQPAYRAAYLDQVQEVYATDAYNSLSIEGYRVNAELIERVRSGRWDPRRGSDRDHRDALAARGYWQAFQKVKDSVARVLDGDNAGTVAQRDHGHWYRELFGPSVAAGLMQPADLAGYRNGPVYIRHSKHVPPRSSAVRELLQTFFAELRAEPEAAVRVVLGHFMLVYVHPYPDGNGRIGRFLMNVMLASGGYPWLVVPVTQRERYMAALEAASVDMNIKPLTAFLAALMNHT